MAFAIIVSASQVAAQGPHIVSRYSAAFSPDGARVLSGRSNGTLELWDAATGTLQRTLLGSHYGGVTSVVFSPDGKRVLSGSVDRTLKLWDASTGALLSTFLGHSETVTSVAFSPDGRRVLSGSSDRTLRLWDVATGVELITLLDSAEVTSVAFSPEGARVLSGSYDALKLWDVAKGALLSTFRGGSGEVTSVAFSPDGRRVLAGAEIAIIIWDVAARAQVSKITLHSHEPPPKGVALLPSPPLPSTSPYTPVRIFFGTDRKLQRDSKRIQFTADRAARLQLGRAIVTVPKAKERKPGEITLPRWWERVFLGVPRDGDPAKHFTILPDGFESYTSTIDFVSAVRKHMQEAGDYRDHAFVFVHGFNMSFDAALFRTAQIAYDLGYDAIDGMHVPFGTAFLYSWPSGADLTDYLYDADSARLAADHLHKFLDLVASKSGVGHVHLIAHSMGNVALLNALQKFAEAPRTSPLVSQIILAAPDVDAAEFELIARAIVPIAKGITLYASSNDLAMKAARDLRRGVPRAGDILLGNPIVVDKIYTIDVSSLSTDFLSIKHGTYSESRELLEDMRRILTKGEHPPDKRSSNFLRRVKGSYSYWSYSQ